MKIALGTLSLMLLAFGCLTEDSSQKIDSGHEADAALDGIDSTVGLDTTRSQFTNLLVPGACPVGDDLGFVDVSAILLNGPESSLTPTSTLRDQPGVLGDNLTPENFDYSHAPSGNGLEKVGYIDPDRIPAALLPEGLEYLFPGGEAAQTKDRLVVFLMDSSGSLIGEGPRGGGVDVANASDRNDERITFFSQLLRSLPSPSDNVSLIWFNDLPTIRVEYAAPTRNREIIEQGLNDEVQFAERGQTQTAAALEAALNTVILANSSLNPMVILFTDGVEDEDALDLTAVTERYMTAADQPVPVIVLDLQPRAGSALAQGRDPKLLELACKTGGEYIYLPNAQQFTESRNLLSMVRSRLRGVWRVRTRTDMNALPAGQDYFLSTVLTASVGASQNSFPMENVPGLEDTRLWFYK
jgi:hypothetical protein